MVMARSKRTAQSRPFSRTLADNTFLDGALTRIDWGDTWVTPLLSSDSHDVADWNRAVFTMQPGWVEALISTWHRFLAAIRFPVSRKDPAGVGFPERGRSATELLTGVDSTSLSFRCRVAVQDEEVSVTTIVEVHNWWGRMYWSVVRPIHPRLIKATLSGVPAPLSDPVAALGRSLPIRLRKPSTQA
jgi:hypothetical protein